MASLLSLRNMAILAALALSSLGINLGQVWHTWKVEYADKQKYDALAETNKSNDAITQQISQKLTECVGKQTASDSIAEAAIKQRDDALAKLAKAKSIQSTKMEKIYATPDCQTLMSSGVCPAVSNSVRKPAGP